MHVPRTYVYTTCYAALDSGTDCYNFNTVTSDLSDVHVVKWPVDQEAGGSMRYYQACSTEAQESIYVLSGKS